MNILSTLTYEIEKLKMLKVLDWEQKYTSWYEGEIESLSQTLVVLLKQPGYSKTNVGV